MKRFETLPDEDSQDWTGERFVTGMTGEIVFEHRHRYLFAAQFCEGRRVLDIASGEGYGSDWLAQRARSVIGVDIAQDAVDAANAKYRRANLEFRQGDCRAIPVDDGSIDVAVSFETLEHVAEHAEFLAELKRVLAPGGILVMSTPDKTIYTPEGSDPNPFHVLELTRAEFEALIATRFANQRMGLQKAFAGSLIIGDETGARLAEVYRRVADGGYESTGRMEAARFLVAVASDGALPQIDWSLLEDDMFLQHLQIRLRHTEAREIAHKQVLNDEIAALKQQLAAARAHALAGGAAVEASPLESHRLTVQTPVGGLAPGWRKDGLLVHPWRGRAWAQAAIEDVYAGPGVRLQAVMALENPAAFPVTARIALERNGDAVWSKEAELSGDGTLAVDEEPASTPGVYRLIFATRMSDPEATQNGAAVYVKNLKLGR